MITTIRSRVYFITPAETRTTSEIVELVRAAVQGGAGLIQYRVKGCPTSHMIQQAQALVRITRPAHVPLIINDRVDVALAVGADGVHVGAEDMPPAFTRRLMGPHAIVGVTAPELAQAHAAERDAATYVSCGPIFASPTKPEKAPVGVLRLLRLREALSVPVCAIGGITEETLPALAQANPSLVAVSSAIAQADDPRRTTRRLVELAEQYLPHLTFGP